MATDAIAKQLDQAQHDAASGGPCLSTLTGDTEMVVSQDLAQDERWPEFADVAVEHGFRSAAAYRLFLHHGEGQSRLGALNLFGREPELDELSVEIGGVFAAHCSAVLARQVTETGLLQTS